MQIEYKSKLGSANGICIAYQFQNPVQNCRCMKGECKNQSKFCRRVTDHTTLNLINYIWKRFNATLPFKSDTHYESRKYLIRGVTFSHMNSLAFQDNLFLTTKNAKQRKHEIDSIMLKLKNCIPSKSRRYHNGSARGRAQQIIQEVLSSM